MKVEFETFNPPYEDMMTILGRTKDQHNIHWAEKILIHLMYHY